jgi:pilus assembly protein Flp/PilA
MSGRAPTQWSAFRSVDGATAVVAWDQGESTPEGGNMLEHIAYAATALRERMRREEGQALVEYALILFLIAVVCIAVLTALGQGVQNTLQSIVNAI